MISDKTYTPDEFHTKAREFAQAFIDKINTVGVSLSLKQEGPVNYLITLNKPNGKESYSIFLNNESKIETISVYGA
ncbi:hypothetical protein KNT87_gp191 [Erwinia phage Cronus]|uniref:DUF7320 domain-containing protein n=1 Tax=Erwinia phage Cronus TaxID=2163633 RepID=A0A2S1GLV9_9CAUD|nr:hypothetical protein KNT87_gp191 [Erwinia phage Cronus]AWD90378.1 hypothetical protein [Erwinia phage Cronus]